VTTAAQEKIGSGFGARTTAREVLAGIDLTGRLALVTGGYSGLGLETTRALVQQTRAVEEAAAEVAALRAGGGRGG